MAQIHLVHQGVQGYHCLQKVLEVPKDLQVHFDLEDLIHPVVLDHQLSLVVLVVQMVLMVQVVPADLVVH